MNPITMQIVADKYIRMALEEDINSEDVSTNAVMPRYQLGTVDLICKQDGIIAGLDVFARAFQLLDEKIEIAFHAADGDAVKGAASGNRDGRYPCSAFRRTHRPQLFAAHERHRNLYECRCKAACGYKNNPFGYKKNHSLYESV